MVPINILVTAVRPVVKSRRQFGNVMTALVGCFVLWMLFAVPTAFGLYLYADDRAPWDLLLLGVLAGVGPAGVIVCGVLAIMSYPQN